MENQTAIVQSVEETALKGKYGYHRCDYATYLRLKRLHREFWIHVRRRAAWERWNAKTVHCDGPEPKYFSDFAVSKKLGKFAKPKTHKNGDIQHYGWIRDTESHNVRKLFLAAKTPHAEKVEPFNSDELRWIGEFESALKIWESK